MKISELIKLIYKQYVPTPIEYLRPYTFLQSLNKDKRVVKLINLFSGYQNVKYFNRVLHTEDWSEFVEWVDKQPIEVLIEAGFTYHELIEINYSIVK